MSEKPVQIGPDESMSNEKDKSIVDNSMRHFVDKQNE
jgi:hypothetical protein